MNSVLGRALAFPPRPDGRGGLVVVAGVAAVEDSINAIITSLKGSHVLEPWLGLPSFVFQPVNDVAAIEEIIKEAIVNGEDRVDPASLRVTIDVADFDQGFVPISIAYSVAGDATQRTLETGYRALI